MTTSHLRRRIDRSAAESWVLLTMFVAATVLGAAAGATPPNLGPFVLLPGDSTIGPAAGDQIDPAIARGNDQYLSVWQDDRGDSPDIYAARLDASGSPIDTLPIAITQAAGAQTNPRVAWNGSVWLVTWQSQIPTEFYYAAGVLGVRVSPQGEILDQDPITIIAYQNSSGLMYGLASDGSNWAVVSEGTSAGEAAIRGIRIAPDGTVLDPGGVVVVAETYYLRFGIDLGGVPGEYLMVWNEWHAGTNDDVLAFRLTPTMQRIEATPLVITSRPNYETSPKIASNGVDFFVAWNLNDNYLASDVYGTRVTYNGQVLDPNGVAFSAAGYGYGRNPAVTWDGSNWIASWPNYGSGGLNAGRMTPQGDLLEPGGVGMPDLGWGAIAGKADGGFVAAWSDAVGGSQDAYGASVTGSLTPGPRMCTSLGAPRQTQLALATDGDGYLAVFLSATSSGSRVVGQRLSSLGGALDPEPFEIAGPAGRYEFPSVAWNGSLYLVSWVDQGQIYARRVDVNGTVIDDTAIPVMNGQESSVAAVGDDFLVVGNDAPSNPQFVYVFGTRVRGTDGTILDPSPLPIGGSFSLSPRVATVGTRWLVVWEQHPTHDDPHAACMASFVDDNGGVATAFTVATAAPYNFSPTVTAKDDTAFVAWSDSRAGFNDFNIYGRRVLGNGTVLDGSGFAVLTASNDQTLPAVASDGMQFVTLCQDFRNIPYFFDEHLDVYGARVTTSGQVLDPSGFALAAEPIPSEILPAGAGVGGNAVLGCSQYRVEAPYAAFRVGLRLLTTDVMTAIAPTTPRVNSLTAWPNPFNPVTWVRFTVTRSSDVQVAIFDLGGHEIRRLYRGSCEPGIYERMWDGTDATGSDVAAGVYLCRLASSDGVRQTQKLTLVK